MIKNYFQSIEKDLKIAVVCFSDFSSNPLYESVVSGINLFCQGEYDLIAAVGGGSAIDVAKCIKLFFDMDHSKNYLQQTIIPNDIKLLAIPTTAGTGSEATQFAVIYYKGEKQSVTNDSCIPDAVVMDPSVLKTLPIYQRKSTAMDALCHGIESFWSIYSTNESMEYSQKAIKKILANLDGYLKGDYEAGREMLFASHLAGKAINIAQTTAGHAMCYKLTSMYGIAHGHGAALCVREIWPYMIANIDKCVDPRGKEYLSSMFYKLAVIMGYDSAKTGAEGFQKIFGKLELEIPKYNDRTLEILARSVNSIRLKNNPVSLSMDAIFELYSRILEKG